MCSRSYGLFENISMIGGGVAGHELFIFSNLQLGHQMDGVIVIDWYHKIEDMMYEVKKHNELKQKFSVTLYLSNGLLSFQND